MNKSAALFFIISSLACTEGFVAPRPGLRDVASTATTLLRDTDPIISPFDNSSGEATDGGAQVATQALEGPLELTWDNVEAVLDEMRPFLLQDGGNVAITEIDGPVVRLELQVLRYDRLIVLPGMFVLDLLSLI